VNKKPNNFLVLGVAVIVISLITLLISVYSNAVNRKFITKGIETEVTITGLRKQKVLSGKSYHTEYSINVMFFTIVGDTEILQKADSVLKSEDAEKQINRIIDNIKYKSKIGEFTSAKAIINEKLYNELKKGDKIKILYLPQDPEKIRVKELVLAFSSKSGYIISAVSFFLALVLLIFSKRKQILQA